MKIGDKMSQYDLELLGNLLVKLVRQESLTESERLAAMKLVNVVDQLGSPEPASAHVIMSKMRR